MSRFFIEFPLMGLDYGPDHTIFEENGETWAQIGTREGSNSEYALELGNNNGNDSQNGVANLRMCSGNRLFTVNKYTYSVGRLMNHSDQTGAAASMAPAGHYQSPIVMFKVVVETIVSPIHLDFRRNSGYYRRVSLGSGDFAAMGITSGVAYVCVAFGSEGNSSSDFKADIYINGQLRAKRFTTASPSMSETSVRLSLPKGVVVSSVCSALGYKTGSTEANAYNAPMPAWALSPNFSVKRVKAKRLLEYVRDEDAPESDWKENDVTLEQIESGFKLYDKTRISFETDYEDNPNMQPLGFCAHFTAGYTRRSPKYGTCLAGTLSGYVNSPEDESRFQYMSKPWANAAGRHVFLLQDFGVQTRRLGGGRITKVGTTDHSDMKYLQFQADINLDPG